MPCYAALAALFLFGPAAAQQDHTLTGDIRMHKSFHSKILNNDRDILVYLPPGYESNKKKRYSVLYLNDGQNLFDGATSFIPGQEWRVDETVQSLIATGQIEPLIVVGIYNTGKDRINEYTPTEDQKFKMGGKADVYGRMLVEELSPSVWFANKQILREIEAVRKKPPLRIWVDTGTKEGTTAEEAQQTVVNARLLKETLVRKGWRLGKDLSYFEAEGAEHNERAWATRMEPVLKFLFPR